jgi:hypothetical protein
MALKITWQMRRFVRFDGCKVVKVLTYEIEGLLSEPTKFKEYNYETENAENVVGVVAAGLSCAGGHKCCIRGSKAEGENFEPGLRQKGESQQGWRL